MKRLVLVLVLLGCSSPQSAPAPAPAFAPTAATTNTGPSQNERLYTKGEELEKEGNWEEAANTYQKYVYAMGDGLSHMDRSSMELRISKLRAKVWPKFDGPPKPAKIPDDLKLPHTSPCAKPYEEGRYEDAIACWRDDYAKTKDPADVYLAARANELNHDLVAATQLYVRFLEVADVGNEASSVKKRIDEVTSRRAESPRR